MDYGQQQAQQQKKEQKQKHDLLIAAYRDVLGTASGRRVIWDILDMTGLFIDKNVGGDQTYVLLGRETIGLDILRRLEGVGPTVFPKLIMEMNNG